MKIAALFPHQKYIHSQDHETHLVVRLQAPALDVSQQRANICVIPAIDISGSMSGDKLDYAKRSVLKLVEHLRSDDVIGLVSFGTSVSVQVLPEPATPDHKSKLCSAVNKLFARGGTNFEGGLSKSLQIIQDLDLPPRYRSRVIMFTDGEPTSGVVDKNQILTILDASRSNVTVSAFGYGNGTAHAFYSGCDQQFLSGVSQRGAGNYAYIQNPDDALSAFGKELGGLLSTYATHIQVSVEPVSGHQITSVVSDVDAQEPDVTGVVDVKVPDILSEEERNLVFGVKINKQDQAFPRDTKTFSINVSWSVVTESGTRETKTAEASATVRFVRKDQDEAEPSLVRVIRLAELSRAQIEAEKKAQAGDHAGAAAVFDNYAQRVSDDEVLVNASNDIRLRYSSASSYSSSNGYRVSARRGITRGMGLVSADVNTSALFTSAGVTTSNSAQGAYSNLFVEGGSSNDPSENQGAPLVDGSVLSPGGDLKCDPTPSKISKKSAYKG